MAGLLQGKPEFVLIDDQKLVHETILAVDARADARKQVVIVQGGPGTGKSVVAINLLGTLIGRGRNARYVSKNAAPRAVYEARLAGTFTKTRISNLFSGSVAYGPTKISSLYMSGSAFISICRMSPGSNGSWSSSSRPNV